MNKKLQSEIDGTSRKANKKKIRQAAYSIGSDVTEDDTDTQTDTDTDLTEEASDYGESDFDQITKRFTSFSDNLRSTLTSAKDKLSRKKDRNLGKDGRSLLGDDDNDITDGSSTDSRSEYSTESESRSESITGSGSSSIDSRSES